MEFLVLFPPLALLVDVAWVRLYLADRRPARLVRVRERERVMRWAVIVGTTRSAIAVAAAVIPDRLDTRG